MKKLLAPIAILAFALTGCGGEPETADSVAPEPAPTVTVTVESEPVAEPEPVEKTYEEKVDDVFLEAVRDSYPELKYSEDESLITIGERFCEMYDGGAVGDDINDFILTASGVEYTLNELVSIHGAAVGAFCPEHVSKM